MLFRSHRFTKEARKDPVLESLLGQGILYTAALIPLKLRSWLKMAGGWEEQNGALCQKRWLLNSRSSSYLLCTLLISESLDENASE